MNFEKLRTLYVLSCIVLCLIFLSPTLAVIAPVPEGQKFSELWVLGPTHMLEGYPFNVSAGETYKVYLGVGNRMGHLGYYRVSVKFRNQSELSPSSSGAPSPLAPLFEYNVFLSDDETWEREFSFSFEGVSYDGNVCRVSKVLVGDYAVDVNKVAVWNNTSNAFYYQLFFELWIYNVTGQNFQFHNRWVGLWLNMSDPSEYFNLSQHSNAESPQYTLTETSQESKLSISNSPISMLIMHSELDITRLSGSSTTLLLTVAISTVDMIPIAVMLD